MASKKLKSLTTSTIEHGAYSGLQTAFQSVITNDADWDKLWATHVSNRHPQPMAPKVDFSKKMILAVSMGPRSSGGYATKIEKVEDDGTNLVVTYSEAFPAGMATMAFTQPFHFVEVKKSAKPVKFQKARAGGCGCKH